MCFSTFELAIIEKHCVFQHLSSRDAAGRIRDASGTRPGRTGTRPGRTGTHVRGAPGCTGTRQGASGARPGRVRGGARPGRVRGGANGGEQQQQQEQDISVPPALATLGITSRAHTASRRDHVTDTEHDFPVWGDGQAGLTPPTSNIISYLYIIIYRCIYDTYKTSLRLIRRLWEGEGRRGAKLFLPH